MGFWKWFSEDLYSNCFTLLTVLLSGVISWMISAVYYHKGNRTNLQMSVILPIKDLLYERYTIDNYKTLCKLRKEYSVKYLKKSERKVLVALCSAYKDISKYDENDVNIEILFSYFETTLKHNNINFEPVPIIINGEVADYEPPEEYFDLYDDLARTLGKFDPYYQPIECQNAVINLFKHYCKMLCPVDNIEFFADNSLVDILLKSEERAKWKEKFKIMNTAKETFMNLKLAKNLTQIK